MMILIKRILPAVALAGLLVGSAQAQVKLGTIDLRKVFDGYWKTKQADAGLKERAADMEKEHKNMLDDYKKAREDYQQLVTAAADQAVAQEERDRRKRTAEDKLRYLKDQEETIGQYERQARQTLDEQRRRMRETILTEIRSIVNAKAKTAAFTMILDVAAESANGTPVLMFTTGDNDITEEVLKQLNATAPADAGKAEAPKAVEKKDEKKAPAEAEKKK